MKKRQNTWARRGMEVCAFFLMVFTGVAIALAADPTPAAGGAIQFDSGTVSSGRPVEKAPSTEINVLGMRREIEEKGFATVYIQFSSNSADILPESQPQLGAIHTLLQEESALNLRIVGHTDSMGQAAYNKQLSQKRAESVQRALVARGIDASRLAAEGMGEEIPVADNKTPEGRARNRRVELVKAN